MCNILKVSHATRDDAACTLPRSRQVAIVAHGYLKQCVANPLNLYVLVQEDHCIDIFNNMKAHTCS